MHNSYHLETAVALNLATATAGKPLATAFFVLVQLAAAAALSRSETASAYDLKDDSKA